MSQVEGATSWELELRKKNHGQELAPWCGLPEEIEAIEERPNGKIGLYRKN